jgi:hypothetical protein
MRKHTRFSPLAAAVALGIAATPSAAQQHQQHQMQHGPMPTAGLRAELIKDVETLESRFLALADAMNGKYDWRPGAGVRSVSEVFMHVAGGNFLLPSMAGVQPPEDMRAADMNAMMGKMQELEKVTDPVKVKETLQHSFMHAKHAIAQVPDDQLDATTKMFGQDATKRQVLNLIVTHLHEHLGQSIAYARVNGVVPPWSAAGGM